MEHPLDRNRQTASGAPHTFSNIRSSNRSDRRSLLTFTQDTLADKYTPSDNRNSLPLGLNRTSRKRQREAQPIDSAKKSKIIMSSVNESVEAKILLRGSNMTKDKSQPEDVPPPTSHKYLPQGQIGFFEQFEEEFDDDNIPSSSDTTSIVNSKRYDENGAIVFPSSRLPKETPEKENFFTKISSHVLFGVILGQFDDDGLRTTMRLRLISKGTQSLVDRLLNAVVQGENGTLSSPRKHKSIPTMEMPSTGDSKHIDVVNNADARARVLEACSPISVLRDDFFLTNAMDLSSHNPIKCDIVQPDWIHPSFVPSLHSSIGQKLADLMNSENEVVDSVIPRRVWKWWIHSLNHIKHFTVDESFYTCNCEACEYVEEHHGIEGGDPKSKANVELAQNIKIARRHSFLRFVLALQILVRNRNTVETVSISGPAKHSAFNTLDDHELPDLKNYIPGLSSLDARLEPDNQIQTDSPSLFSAGPKFLKSMFLGSKQRWKFSMLQSITFSSTVDVRHAIPFIDGCDLPNLKSVKFAWLEAKYDMFTPQFGLLPIAVFAPNSLFNEEKDESAPHLPAIYNGSLDSTFKLNGLGMYSCPIYTYEGNFEAGLNSQFGKMRANTGETYEGMWHRGLRYGHGRVTQDAGCIMEGTWNEDLLHGIGYIVKPEGLFYLGQWYHSAWDGWGIFAYKGRLIGYGQFSHGLLHGWARILMSSGAWEDAWWHHGKRVSDEVLPEHEERSMAIYRRRIIVCYYEGKTIVYPSATRSLLSPRTLPSAEGGYFVYKEPESILSGTESIAHVPIESPTPLAGHSSSVNLLPLDEDRNKPGNEVSTPSSIGDDKDRSQFDHGDCAESTVAPELYRLSPNIPTTPPTSSPSSVYSAGSSPTPGRRTAITMDEFPTAFSPVTTFSPDHGIYRRMDGRRHLRYTRQDGREFNSDDLPSPSPTAGVGDDYEDNLIWRITSPAAIGTSNTSTGSTVGSEQVSGGDRLLLPLNSDYEDVISSSVSQSPLSRGGQRNIASSPQSISPFSISSGLDRVNDSDIVLTGIQNTPTTQIDGNWENFLTADLTNDDTSSEWSISGSNDIEESDDDSNASATAMAFSILTEIGERCDWADTKVLCVDKHNVEKTTEMFKPTKNVLLLRTNEGGPHVRYPPLSDGEQQQLRSRPAPSFLLNQPATEDDTKSTSYCLGYLKSMSTIGVARPKATGDLKLPGWVATYLQTHYGIDDPLEPLPSAHLFNKSHTAFFDAKILNDLKQASWSAHQKNIEAMLRSDKD